MKNNHNSELQAVVAITKHIGIKHDYMYAYGGDLENKAGNYGYGKLNDFGIGYFNQLNPNLQWEIYGGYVHGFQQHQLIDNGNSYFSRIQVNKFYLQPAIAYSYKWLQVYAFAGFNNVHCDKYPGFNFGNSLNHQMTNQSFRFYTIEPGFGIRYGIKHFKIEFQGMAIAYYFQNSDYIDYTIPSSFPNSKSSIGITFNFNAKNLIKKPRLNHPNLDTPIAAKERNSIAKND